VHTRIITVARELGSEGGAIARGLAESLSFRYVDGEVVTRAAEVGGVPVEYVRDNEHARPLPVRLLEAIAKTPTMVPIGQPTWVPGQDPSARQHRIIEDVLRDLAHEGDVLIRGHGAQFVLKERWDTVRVLITGSLQLRTCRVASRRGISLEEAQRVVARADRERRDYFQQLYHIEWLCPAGYDITLSTDHMSVPHAIETLAAFARGR
jgi:cytidylate kinase